MRRTVLALVGVVAMAAGLAACGSSGGGGSASHGASAPAKAGSSGAPAKSGGEIVVSTWGGDYTKAEKKWFGDPFTKETGIKVKYQALSNSPMTPVMLQAQSGNMKIDVVDAESPGVLRAKGLLAKFPGSLEKTLTETSRPGTFTADTMKIGQTALVIACNPDMVKKCPENPQQFWDVKNYPGKRGILVGLPQTVVNFLGGGQVTTLPKAIFDSFRTGIDPLITAIASLLMVATGVLMLATTRLRRGDGA